MEDFELIFPTEEYEKEVELYKKNMLDNNSRMDGCGSLRIDDFNDWLTRCKEYKDGKNLLPNMPPYIQYICVRKSDNKVIGMLQIRHKTINPIFGHIGYSIAFDERGKGYSKMMLNLGLIKCKELGLDKVMINCLVTNEASRRCILANGGVLFDRMFVKERNYDIERYYIYLDKEM